MPYDIFILYALATGGAWWGLKLEQSQVAMIEPEIDRGWLDMESWELALKAGWEDSKSYRHQTLLQLAKAYKPSESDQLSRIYDDL